MYEKRVDIYIATRGGVKAKEGRYGYVVEYITSAGETKTREGFGAEKETTSQRLTLAALKSAMTILREPCVVVLHMPDPFVRGAFLSHQIVKWGIHGCQTSEGKTIANAQLWQEVYELQVRHIIKIAEDGANNPYTNWMKEQM